MVFTMPFLPSEEGGDQTSDCVQQMKDVLVFHYLPFCGTVTLFK
jgi:hypothetical protein